MQTKSKTIKVVTIDDEKLSRDLMEHYVNEIDGLEVVGTATNATEGIAAIKEHEPDIILLDIEMPGQNGFDLLNHFAEPTFKTIIVTAYNKYAIKAIKHAAFDYIVKPIDPSEFGRTIKRFSKERESGRQVKILQSMLSKGTKDEMVLNSQNKTQVIKFDDIIFLRADGSYTQFICKSGQHLVTKPLKHYEDFLPISTFYRCHKSYLVNRKHILEMNSGRSAKIRLSNGMDADVSSRRLPGFRKWFTKNRIS